MKYAVHSLFAVFLLIGFFSALANAGELTIVTSEHAPFNYVEDELSAYFALKKLGYIPDQFIFKAFKLDLKLDGCMAFSRNSDKKLVHLFRQTLKSLVKGGRY